MQFVEHGPDIPDKLLQAHEEGRVVFFCGAGISYKLGLPGFKGLVHDVRAVLGDVANNEEAKLEELELWDAVLDYLEKKIARPSRLRQALVRVLTPKSDNIDSSAYDTHRSLLTLSRTRTPIPNSNRLHLVTTNFDRAFETIRSEFSWEFKSYAAPFIPIPKEIDWNGIVYLHGLIPEAQSENHDLRDLIVTSGGFGRAYLSERWASRFVSELFRNYIVCFVGYSLKDPVMHYLLDAVEADRASGEKTNPVYWFVDNSELKERPEFARNETILKIPYDNYDGHSLLHMTLKAWASVYSKGSQGKVAIVETEACIDPDVSRDTGYQGRVIWALSDKSGIPARQFAEMEKCPPIGWLKVLEQACFGGADVVSAERPALCFNEKLGWSDNRTAQLYEWSLNYLNHPLLIERCANVGVLVNQHFKDRLQFKISEYEKLKSTGACDELARIRERRPYAIPGDFATKIWHLLILGRLLPSSDRHTDMLALIESVKAGTVGLYQARRIAEYFIPRIRIKKRWAVDGNSYDNLNPGKVLEWNLECGELGDSYFAKEIRDALTSDCECLLEEMVKQLVASLDDACYLDQFAECGYRLTLDIPSIEDHSQNSPSKSCRCAIDIIRDSWLKIADTNVFVAKEYYQTWIRSPHYLFRRLALFAAKREDVVDSRDWVEALLVGNGLLLWQPFSKREVCRLLVTRGRDLSANDLLVLTETIIKGPPPCMFLHIQHDNAQGDRYRDRMIWLRLAKLEESGCVLPENVQNSLNELKQNYGFKLNKWQMEEFLSWHSGTGSPDYEEEKFTIELPKDVDSLAAEICSSTTVNRLEQWGCEGDDFSQLCEQVPGIVLGAFRLLLKQGAWKVDRIGSALRTWRQPDLHKYALRLLEESIPLMPPEVFYELAGVFADWLQEGVKAKSVPAELLKTITLRILDKPYSQDDDEIKDYGFGPIGAAINHPAGKVIEAVIDACFPSRIKKGSGIKEPWRTLFSVVCQSERAWLRHGRVIIASRCVAFYYADENWVVEKLLPRFNWERNAVEAASMWAGFVRNLQLHAPLLRHMKTDLLNCATNISQFTDEDARLYSSYVVAMGVYSVDGYDYEDYRQILLKFPLRELEYAARALSEIIEGRRREKYDGDERWTVESCWEEQIKPFVQYAWPKDAKLITPSIRSSFCRLVCFSGSSFTEAFAEVKWILGPVDEKSYLLHVIEHEGLAKDFPKDVLDLLSIIVDRIQWCGSELRKLLDIIKEADCTLARTDSYLRLEDLVRTSVV